MKEITILKNQQLNSCYFSFGNSFEVSDNLFPIDLLFTSIHHTGPHDEASGQWGVQCT